MTITFYGAAGSVTGSKHLIEAGGRRILLDCGTFQGLADTRERNRSLAFGPDTVDAVIISHAHLDHCGMLPLLVKRGYKGPIYCTPATRDVMEYMLSDAAHIEVQDAEYRARHKLDSPDERVPLFTPEDIPAVMNRVITVPYFRVSQKWFPVAPGIQFKFYEAGHILGSAVTVLEVDDPTSSDFAGRRPVGPKRLAFTGDLGPHHMPLLRDPEVPTEEISTLLMESTYGGREHAPLDEAYGKLVKFINDVVARKGKIIVPAFSLGRTQMLVYIIHKLTDEGKIPRFPIYVDSPLAGHITEIYDKYQDEYDAETKTDFKRHGDVPLAFRNLTYVQTVDESKKLNFLPGPFMIIASSGMMTGGRVIHHLRHNLSDERNAIFITGYQAEGTLGRRLLEGVKWLDLYGQRLPVHAQVEVFNEFSAHADGRELQKYAEAIKGLKRIYLVHGEPVQADVLQQHLAAVHPDWVVRRPREGEMATV